MARLLAKQGVAAGRFGTPAEIAAAVVVLASEQAAWITGATLEGDGGTLCSDLTGPVVYPVAARLAFLTGASRLLEGTDGARW